MALSIHILSDLHLEFAPYHPPAVEADVIILAGDTHLGVRGVKWAREVFPDKPVIYVAGNHEFYGEAYPTLSNKLRREVEGSNVHVMENDAVRIGNVLFLGCTLWTDFALAGNSELARYEAAKSMSDYRKIRMAPSYRRLSPRDTYMWCIRSQSWLRDQFRDSGTDQLVVVTHHAPSARSVPSEFARDTLSAAYASNLDDLVAESGAALWIHGHIHSACDYQIGATRVICNPRGYPDEPDTGFDPQLVVTLNGN
jgi:Icc-related predicted phosphoesterase